MNSGNGQNPAKRKKDLPELPKTSMAKTVFIIGSLFADLYLVFAVDRNLWPLGVLWAIVMIIWGSVGR